MDNTYMQKTFFCFLWKKTDFPRSFILPTKKHVALLDGGQKSGWGLFLFCYQYVKEQFEFSVF